MPANAAAPARSARITLEAKSRAEAMARMIALYPDYKEADFFLKYSIENHVR